MSQDPRRKHSTRKKENDEQCVRSAPHARERSTKIVAQNAQCSSATLRAAPRHAETEFSLGGFVARQTALAKAHRPLSHGRREAYTTQETPLLQRFQKSKVLDRHLNVLQHYQHDGDVSHRQSHFSIPVFHRRKKPLNASGNPSLCLSKPLIFPLQPAVTYNQFRHTDCAAGNLARSEMCSGSLATTLLEIFSSGPRVHSEWRRAAET